ncbi:sestrin-1-like [Hydractinia symbiolongicarpus]|uniref:sestrin-1-like n=1 Tax=Hydractinia symbiolongicarpus TaxID=13093 RepID=UPI00254A42A2|nr:sestrin-1-like [Hydractinia symbiolongicarpus]
MQSNDSQACLLLSPLQTKDVVSRKQFLEELEKEFDDDLEKEKNRHLNGHNHNSVNNSNICNTTSFYPVLLRLAHECPFHDVRLACEGILLKLENKGVRIPRRKVFGPSKFISTKDCVSIDTTDDEVHGCFVDAFLFNGRTSHIHQLLGYHIQYLSCFLQFESLLMRCNGSLRIDWRYYIGIMGAARHQCDILIQECEKMFLMMDGDPQWLNGVQNVPVKLQKLTKLSKILAHQPWLLSEPVIKDLLVGPPAETWSVSELIHAIVILVHYQTLSGFVFGCGITPEIDSKNGHSQRSQSSGECSSGTEVLTPTKLRAPSLDTKEQSDTTAGLFQKIQKIKREETDNSQEEEESEKLRQFQEVETKELDDESMEGDSFSIDSDYDRYIEDKNFHYEEFAKRKTKDIEVFRAQDYSWQQHCFAFINRLFPEMGTLLDDKFRCSFNLTYNTMGDSITDVDTSKFRLATWNYIHLVYGIFHDDYVYYEVNKLLEKAYKSYIKKVACFPERTTFLDYHDYYTDLLPSEKVHINLLVLESRMQAILLYASRSIMKYMNQC